VLIYWPFDDLVDNPEGLMRQLGVHENKWLIESSAGRLAIELLHAGYGFDFISDAQISQLRVENGALVAPGGRYRALVIPRLRRISLSTLARLSMLDGAPLIAEAVPEDVPGLGQLEARREKFVRTLAAMHWADRLVRPNVSAALRELGVVPEPASRVPLGNLRRARDDGYDYFFVNHGAAAFNGWLQLATPATAALLMDPLSGRAGLAALRAGEQGRARVYLQLASGESMILRTYRGKSQQHGLSAWPYTASAGEGQTLAGEWQVDFMTGSPKLPASFKPPGPLRLPALRSWTELDDPALTSFAGTARYRIEFDAPAKRADAWLLDLGDVREAARVSLNGEPVGNAWSLPFTLRLPGNLRPRGNLLEIEVTNLPANRIRDLDLRKVDWKVMKEINLVTLRYKPFDASGWQPAPSGLLGPVRLVPLEVVRPR
jgi:hypothetical protein